MPIALINVGVISAGGMVRCLCICPCRFLILPSVNARFVCLFVGPALVIPPVISGPVSLHLRSTCCFSSSITGSHHDLYCVGPSGSARTWSWSRRFRCFRSFFRAHTPVTQVDDVCAEALPVVRRGEEMSRNFLLACLYCWRSGGLCTCIYGHRH